MNTEPDIGLDAEEKDLVLVGRDGQMTVNRKHCHLSGFLQAAVEMNTAILPIKTDLAALRYLIQYLDIFSGSAVKTALAKPLPIKNLAEYLTATEQQFIDSIPSDKLIDVLALANYTRTMHLAELLAAQMACQIRNRQQHTYHPYVPIDPEIEQKANHLYDQLK